MQNRTKIGILAAVAVLLGGSFLWPQTQERETKELMTQGATLADVVVPASFTEIEQIGQTAFNAKCASCHGENAAGQDGVAPPLVHKIYEPSHHGDEAFVRAALNGVQGHHWPFGNMPPVEGLTRGDIIAIVAYVRQLQRANGIY